MRRMFAVLVSGLVLSISVLNLSATTVNAQGSLEDNRSSSTNVNATETSGEVLKVDGSTLTIDSQNGTKEFNVPANVGIERNSSTVPLNELKPGDKVTVKATDTGEVLSVSATAGSLMDKTKMAAAIAILALIVLFILSRIIKKRNRGFIKTTPTNIKEGDV